MVELKIKTQKKREVIDITEQVNAILQEGEARRGEILHLFVKHTTAALAIADLDPGGTAEDYLEAFEKIVPKLNYRHPHDPSHMPDHILSTLVGISLSLPIQNGKPVLGTWQKVVLFEFDGPRERSVIMSQA